MHYQYDYTFFPDKFDSNKIFTYKWRLVSSKLIRRNNQEGMRYEERLRKCDRISEDPDNPSEDGEEEKC